jgi:hypothetical protein
MENVRLPRDVFAAARRVRDEYLKEDPTCNVSIQGILTYAARIGLGLPRLGPQLIKVDQLARKAAAQRR